MTDSSPPKATKPLSPFDSLLAQCRDLVSERLSEAMDVMLDKMGEALSELIVETPDRDARAVYLETQKKALAQRDAIAEQFRAQYLREFQVRSNHVKKIGQSFSDMDASLIELNLVGEDDLNETLKLNDMATKLRQYCDEELTALDQRIGVLLGDANLEAEDNPFSPEAICGAFKNTSRTLEPNVKIRMVLLKLFDDFVLDDIRAVYKAVNALLVQNSILPKIRYGVSRSKDGRAPPEAEAARAAEKTPPSDGPDFFSVLQDLLAGSAKATSQPGGTGGPGGGAPNQPAIAGVPSSIAGAPGSAGLGGAPMVVLQGAELMDLLTRIQHGDAKASAEVGLPVATSSSGQDPTANVLHELKNTGVSNGMNQMDIMTLDIVAMLFDQLFDDPRIPIAVKGLIGRMQIPMLKVAIADKAFFSKKTHPARQLLDTLGEISSRLPADFSTSNPLFGHLEAIIQELMDKFQDNIEIFDTVGKRLRTLVEEQDQRAEEEARLAAKRIEQNESLAASKTMAEFEVKARVESGKLPRAVREFLMHQWVKPLLIVHVRRGQHSDAWKNSLATMDLLTWSVAEKTTPEERSKLETTIPDLLKRLAAGLKIADIDDEICERFFSELNGIHSELLSQDRESKSASADDTFHEPDLPNSDIEFTLVQPIPPTMTEPPTAEVPRRMEMEPQIPVPAAAAPELAPLEMPKPKETAPPIPDETISIADLPPIDFPRPTETAAPIPAATAQANALPGIPAQDPAQVAQPIAAAGVPSSTPAKTPAQPAAPTSRTIPAAAGPAPASPKTPAQGPAQVAKPITAAGVQTSTPPKPSAQPLAPTARPIPAATGQGPAAPKPPAQAPVHAARAIPAAPGQGSAAPIVRPQTPAQAAKPAATGQGATAPTMPAQAAAQASRPIATATHRAPVPPGIPVPDSRQPVRPPPPSAARAPAPMQAEEMESDSLDFTKVITIKNPFGGGKVQVQELESADAPASVPRAKGETNEVEFINNLKEGVWVEFREKGAEDTQRPARLSYISPLRSRFLFVDRAGKTVKECTRTELGRLVRLGMVAVVDVVVAEEPPLFDRMMAGVIGKLS
jgi:hypothetical protein